MGRTVYNTLLERSSKGEKSLAVLIDPDKFDPQAVHRFLDRIPGQTSHLFVGGSTATNGHTVRAVKALKQATSLPVILFPGDHSQITSEADALLFLSLLSGRNAEYLVGQQVKAIARLRSASLEIIPTGYLLIDGGNESAVARVSQTRPLPQTDVQAIVHTALAGQYMGAKLIYLEAGSGAATPVAAAIISEVKKAVDLPLVVGGGIRSEQQQNEAYKAGADVLVMGTVFEEP